jgi:hypothetical protein
MKKLWFLVLLLLVSTFFSGCKKEEKEYFAEYKITRNGPAAGFTVRYRLPDGTMKSQGPITAEYFLSGKIEGYNPGDVLSLTLESTGGDFTMWILVSGSVSKKVSAGQTGGTQTVEYTIAG